MFCGAVEFKHVLLLVAVFWLVYFLKAMHYHFSHSEQELKELWQKQWKWPYQNPDLLKAMMQPNLAAIAILGLFGYFNIGIWQIETGMKDAIGNGSSRYSYTSQGEQGCKLFWVRASRGEYQGLRVTMKRLSDGEVMSFDGTETERACYQFCDCDKNERYEITWRKG